MLVLTRKINQSIMIGDQVEISILAVSGDKIRLGINAPRDVPVFRREVYESIQDSDADEDEDENQDEGPNRDSGESEAPDSRATV